MTDRQFEQYRLFIADKRKKFREGMRILKQLQTNGDRLHKTLRKSLRSVERKMRGLDDI